MPSKSKGSDWLSDWEQDAEERAEADRKIAERLEAEDATEEPEPFDVSKPWTWKRR